jgi:hypothetical protein
MPRVLTQPGTNDEVLVDLLAAVEPRPTRPRAVWVNDHGHTIGQDHHRARLTDRKVDELHELRAGGCMSYAQLAKQFGISKSHAYRIVKGKCRGQFAVNQRPPRPPVSREPRRRPARPEEFDVVNATQAPPSFLLP